MSRKHNVKKSGRSNYGRKLEEWGLTSAQVRMADYRLSDHKMASAKR